MREHSGYGSLPGGSGLPSAARGGGSAPSRLIVVGSLLTGCILAGVLTMGIFSGAEKPVITGLGLLGFGIGWGALAALSVALTDQPQRWAVVPARALEDTRLHVHMFTPDRYSLVSREQQQGSEIAMVKPLTTGKATKGLRKAVEKLTAKEPDPYEQAIAEYNGAFTTMNDTGLSLLRQRERSTDLVELVELLVNSIANTPKSFESDFDEIDVHKAQFQEAQEFARRDLEAARRSVAGAGAGFTAGAAVAGMAPTAAMWVATTFGTASTGTAISTLSGAAATQAALAWLGGGALAAGGGGVTAGSALLALAGPIGWTLAGATLLVSITLFAKKKFENRAAKQEALTIVKQNTALARGMNAQIEDLLQRTASLRELLWTSYRVALEFFGSDFLTLSVSQQSQLAALVNNTKACGALLSRHIGQDADDE